MVDVTVNTGGILVPVTSIGLPPTTDASVTIGADVAVDGSVLSTLGALPGALLGNGITSNSPTTQVNNLGTITGLGTVPQAVLTVIDAAAAALGVTLPPVPATASGVELTLGGGVTNNAGAAITGALNGVLDLTNPGQVSNQGAITGTAGAGVSLLNGGTVTQNSGSGTITGATVGVSITGSADPTSAVSNQGVISGTGANSTGLVIDAGTVTNSSAPVNGVLVQALISGTGNGLTSTGDLLLNNTGRIVGGTGVGAQLATGEVVTNGGTISGGTQGLVNVGVGRIDNAGTITASAGDGVQAAGDVNNLGGAISGTAAGVALGAGALNNQAGATITGGTAGVLKATGVGSVVNAGTISTTGANGIGVNLLGGGTVVDTGTIGGTDAAGNAGGIAVKLGAGNSRLVLGAGAVLNGGAQAAGTGNTLQIAAGTVPRVIADLGSTIAGFDNTALDAGAAVEVTGAVTQAGTVALGDGAALKLDGPVSAGATVDLGGTHATLTLANPAAFAGTIANLGTDDVLDLTGLAPGSTVSYTPGTGLTITGPDGIAATVAVALPTGDGLTLDASGTGVTVGVGGIGTTITLPGNGTGGTGTTPGGGSTGGGTGGTGTTPGGTTTPGAGGGSTTVVTDPSTGGTTVTTTSPLGATTTQLLPPGSTVAQGTGAAAGDVVSIDPYAYFLGQGQFLINGHVAATSGVKSVTISAQVDRGATVVLGTADVAADGSYSFVDHVGRHLQGFITATATDELGGSTSVQSLYSLRAGLRGQGHVAEQSVYTPGGDAYVSQTTYKAEGAKTVEVREQGNTFGSDFFDTFNNHGVPDSTFVFTPGYGRDVINLFRADGADHDTISLPSADFANLAAVMDATRDTKGGAVITDPKTGDVLQLTGVSKATLKANPSDFSFHA